MIDFTDKDREKVEAISDDFESTFSVAAKDTLCNMMSPRDFENLTGIIKKHLGDVSIRFQKSGYFGDESYDIYAVIVE